MYKTCGGRVIIFFFGLVSPFYVVLFAIALWDLKVPKGEDGITLNRN